MNEKTKTKTKTNITSYSEYLKQFKRESPKEIDVDQNAQHDVEGNKK